MPVAIYARVSTDDKGQDPENQLRQLRAWCSSVGHAIVREYVDHCSGGKGAQHWVGTWSATPYFDSANQPPSSLTNSVLRQVVHVSLGGGRIRVLFSNLAGNGPVAIRSRCASGCCPRRIA